MRIINCVVDFKTGIENLNKIEIGKEFIKASTFFGENKQNLPIAIQKINDHIIKVRFLNFSSGYKSMFLNFRQTKPFIILAVLSRSMQRVYVHLYVIAPRQHSYRPRKLSKKNITAIMGNTVSASK